MGVTTGGVHHPVHVTVYLRSKMETRPSRVVLAPERFVEWMSRNSHVDRRFGHVYHYHSRSDAHSVMLSTLIIEDLLTMCAALRADAEAGRIVYGTNVRFTWASGKSKTLDLAIGEGPLPVAGPVAPARIQKVVPLDVLLACESLFEMRVSGLSGGA
jgi:hypothetical protein